MSADSTPAGRGERAARWRASLGAGWRSRAVATAIASAPALSAATATGWIWVLVASYLDMMRVATIIYLSRCPHGFSAAPSVWFDRAIDHIAAFPLGSLAMLSVCIVHRSFCHSHVWLVTIISAVAMLLIMPLSCEWAWEVSGHWIGSARSTAFLVASTGIFGLFDAIVHVVLLIGIAVREHLRRMVAH